MLPAATVKCDHADTFIESVRRRSISFADNAKRELATLTRRVTMSGSVDATASGQDLTPRSESRYFPLVPSVNRETTTRKPVQDNREATKPLSSGNDASHDETGLEVVMI